jgi:hypothetical protein
LREDARLLKPPWETDDHAHQMMNEVGASCGQ